MTETEPLPTAIDIEQQCLATIGRARAVGVEAAQDGARARAAFEQAETAREAALDAQVREETDADAQLDQALAGARQAAHRVTEAEERGQAALRVRRSSETRLNQVRSTLVDELAVSAEALTVESIQARDAAVAALRRWESLDAAARHRWGELRVGLTAKIEQRDRELGQLRDEQIVNREASSPPPPIDAIAIAKLAVSTARPPLMSGTEAEVETIEQSGPKPLFPGDDGHERHTRGVQADPPGWPLNAPEPASPIAINRAALERAVR